MSVYNVKNKDKIVAESLSDFFLKGVIADFVICIKKLPFAFVVYYVKNLNRNGTYTKEKN